MPVARPIECLPPSRATPSTHATLLIRHRERDNGMPPPASPRAEPAFSENRPEPVPIVADAQSFKAPAPSNLYDAYYFAHGCGLPYNHQEKHWPNFFGGIAERIVGELSPKRVLDAG